MFASGKGTGELVLRVTFGSESRRAIGVTRGCQIISLE